MSRAPPPERDSEFEEFLNKQIIDRSVEQAKPALFAEVSEALEKLKLELISLLPEQAHGVVKDLIGLEVDSENKTVREKGDLFDPVRKRIQNIMERVRDAIQSAIGVATECTAKEATDVMERSVKAALRKWNDGENQVAGDDGGRRELSPQKAPPPQQMLDPNAPPALPTYSQPPTTGAYSAPPVALPTYDTIGSTNRPYETAQVTLPSYGEGGQMSGNYAAPPPALPSYNQPFGYQDPNYSADSTTVVSRGIPDAQGSSGGERVRKRDMLEKFANKILGKDTTQDLKNMAKESGAVQWASDHVERVIQKTLNLVKPEITQYVSNETKDVGQTVTVVLREHMDRAITEHAEKNPHHNPITKFFARTRDGEIRDMFDKVQTKFGHKASEFIHWVMEKLLAAIMWITENKLRIELDKLPGVRVIKDVPRPSILDQQPS